MVEAITKGGFGKLTPEQFMLKRLSEVVDPLRFDFRVAGPTIIPFNLDDDAAGQMGYVISVKGSSLDKTYTMCVPRECMENPDEARRIGEAYGNMLLDASSKRRIIQP